MSFAEGQKELEDVQKYIVASELPKECMNMVLCLSNGLLAHNASKNSQQTIMHSFFSILNLNKIITDSCKLSILALAATCIFIKVIE